MIVELDPDLDFDFNDMDVDVDLRIGICEHWSVDSSSSTFGARRNGLFLEDVDVDDSGQFPTASFSLSSTTAPPPPSITPYRRRERSRRRRHHRSPILATLRSDTGAGPPSLLTLFPPFGEEGGNTTIRPCRSTTVSKPWWVVSSLSAHFILQKIHYKLFSASQSSHYL